jgi:hypothetical protein
MGNRAAPKPIDQRSCPTASFYPPCVRRRQCEALTQLPLCGPLRGIVGQVSRTPSHFVPFGSRGAPTNQLQAQTTQSTYATFYPPLRMGRNQRPTRTRDLDAVNPVRLSRQPHYSAQFGNPSASRAADLARQFGLQKPRSSPVRIGRPTWGAPSASTTQ